MLKIQRQHRSRPQVFSSSRNCRAKKFTNLPTRLKSFLSTCLAISLGFFLYINLYSRLGPSKEPQYETLMDDNDDGSSPVTLPMNKLRRQRLFHSCNNVSHTAAGFWGKRGSFWVLYNYLTPSNPFACDKAVTYTTHADYTYLDSLVPLLERWQGPVSLSLYAPGADWDDTLARVHFLRECSALVKDFVSFHLISDTEHILQNLSNNNATQRTKPSCSVRPKFGQNLKTFRKRNKLMYPVNVGRNVAREMASTHYVLASDIELYPSGNLMRDFLDMIQREGRKLVQSPKPKVFVLPVFEVEAMNLSALPNDKMELVRMLDQGIAAPFHKNICSTCHTIPKQSEWIRAEVRDGLHVFHVGKRLGAYRQWEPFYIGTKSDPMYDERLYWDGRKDKMTQAYILCVLDYEFHILDNAFLVHRPGIKMNADAVANKRIVMEQTTKIRNIIIPQLMRLYGTRPGCSVTRGLRPEREHRL